MSCCQGRRGSIAGVLVIVILLVVVIAPLGVTAIRSICQWYLVRRSHQYVEQVLTFAAQGISEQDLGSGLAKFQTITARSLLTSRFQEHLPAVLQGRLQLVRVRFLTRRLAYDPDHWMGDRQPLTQPVVVIEAVLSDPFGPSVPIVKALEFLVG